VGSRGLWQKSQGKEVSELDVESILKLADNFGIEINK
jgi:hypothetical protein